LAQERLEDALLQHNVLLYGTGGLAYGGVGENVTNDIATRLRCFTGAIDQIGNADAAEELRSFGAMPEGPPDEIGEKKE
jgi:hypothetical protein